jgi:hypothetical protein
MKWVQKSYYQPCTTYQTRTYYEPCTTYRTSYYWDQCTSYRYSCYYDPCTCSYKQVACPVTSYQLRSKCCPVTSYLQRCQLVPVTNYQEVRYYEQVPDCPKPCPDPCPPNGNGAGTAVPPVGTPNIGSPMPGTGQPPVGLEGQPGSGTYKPNMSFDRQLPPVGSRLSPQPQTAPPPVAQPFPAAKPTGPPPAVKLDKIVLAPPQGVEGQVIRASRTPHNGAQVIFVSAAKQGEQRTVTADTGGRFSADLTAGQWLVYVKEADGRTQFQSKLEVRNEEMQRITLTSR